MFFNTHAKPREGLKMFFNAHAKPQEGFKMFFDLHAKPQEGFKMFFDLHAKPQEGFKMFFDHPAKPQEEFKMFFDHPAKPQEVFKMFFDTKQGGIAMKVNKIYAYNLPNAEHFQFHTDFKNLVEQKTPEALKIAPLFQAYLPLYDKVDAAYKKIVKSTITEQMQDANKERDEVWRGLVTANKAVLRHFDPAKRAAAKQIDIVRKTYGDVARMSYNGQTAATDNFVQDMEGPYAQHVAAVGILPWVIELKARNIAFANLVRDRNHESSKRNLTALKEARAELDEAFYAIVRRISAFVEIEGVAAYEPFILELNVHIAKYNLFVAQPSKRGKKSKKETESK